MNQLTRYAIGLCLAIFLSFGTQAGQRSSDTHSSNGDIVDDGLFEFGAGTGIHGDGTGPMVLLEVNFGGFTIIDTPGRDACESIGAPVDCGLVGQSRYYILRFDSEVELGDFLAGGGDTLRAYRFDIKPFGVQFGIGGAAGQPSADEVASFPGVVIQLDLLPTLIERDVRLNRNLSWQIDLVQARAGSTIPLSGNMSLVLSAAVRVLGFEQVQYSAGGVGGIADATFNGFHLIDLEAAGGLYFRLNPDLGLSTMLGARGGMSFGNGFRGETRAYINVTLEILNSIEVYLEAHVAHDGITGDTGFGATDVGVMLGGRFRY